MTEHNWQEACELREKLCEYCYLENDEHGEMVQSLQHLAAFPDYMSQELWDAVIAGMKEELANYQESAQIVKTKTVVEHEYTELVWNELD